MKMLQRYAARIRRRNLRPHSSLQIEPLESRELLTSISLGATDSLFPEITQAAQTSFHGPDLVGKDGPLSNLGYDLTFLYHEYQNHLFSSPGEEFESVRRELIVHDGSVHIEVIAQQNATSLQPTVEALGMDISASVGRVLAGDIAIVLLDELAGTAGVLFASPATPAITNVGAVTSQGDAALLADEARANFNVDGTGITVGVISDSFNTSGIGSAAADVQSGDLPPNVNVFAEEPGTDEGRAMLQIIHDLAPGAALSFAANGASQAEMAQVIRDLAAANTQVIVDDIGFPTEPFFQDGLIAQAVNDVVAAGVSYFSAAGNEGDQSYESPFVNSGIAGNNGVRHDFDPGPGVDVTQLITVPAGETLSFTLQWDDPFASLGGGGATADLDIFLLLGGVPLVGGTNPNFNLDPVEFFEVENDTAFDATLEVVIELLPGSTIPGLMKYIVAQGDVIIEEYATNSSTLVGHPNAAGAAAVAASAFFLTPEFTPAPPPAPVGDQIVVQYQAEARLVTGTPFGLTVPQDTPITGFLRYNTSTPDSEPALDRGFYVHTGGGGFQANFLGTVIDGSTTPTWTVDSIPPVSTLRAFDGPRVVGPQGGTMSINGVPDPDIEMFLAIVPEDQTLLGDDSLPDPWPPFNLTLFGDTVLFTLSDEQGTISIQFTSASEVTNGNGSGEFPAVNDFSSLGSTPILFDTAGNRLIVPEIRQQPHITGVDGVNTTFFGTDIPEDPDAFPNFFGTSAAAPHAAAIAALMLEAAGGPNGLTPSQVKQILQDTAIDITNRTDAFPDAGVTTSPIPNGVGFDFFSGYGLIDAQAAVEAASNTIPPGPPPPPPPPPQPATSVSGFKWDDRDGDGIRDSGEPLLRGWTIYLDLNNNGSRNSNEPFRVTGADGRYSFNGIPEGTYNVREILQPNWIQTFPNGENAAHVVTVVEDNPVTGINFGNLNLATLGGIVFNDLDEDGLRDATDRGVRSVYVYADLNNNEIPNVGEPGTRTDKQGRYSLSLPAGRYSIRLQPPPGWEPTNPEDGSRIVSLAAGQQDFGVPFGVIGTIDYGDAPATYPVLRIDNGARHGIEAGFHLGPGLPGEIKVDAEPNGQPTIGAVGDDETGDDDEDGVLGLDSPLIAGTVKTITVIGSPAQDAVKGKLQGWIDFNADGDWFDAGEQIFTDLVIASGPNELSFDVPAGAVGGPTYARFRISYEFGLPVDGSTLAGEVEDYAVAIDSFFAPFGADAVPLGEISDTTMSNVDIQGPFKLYGFTATQTGTFSILTSFLHSAGNLDLVVYDRFGRMVGLSDTDEDGERVDFRSIANEPYYLRPIGSNPDVDFHFQNALAITSSKALKVVGSPGDDVVRFIVGNSTHRIFVNDVSYLVDATKYQHITVDGGSGHDQITVTGSPGNQTANFYPGRLDVSTSKYEVHVRDAESITVSGKTGSRDRVNFYDSAGSDQFYARVSDSSMIGLAYNNRAVGFERSYAYATAGGSDDVAYLYDSPGNDFFYGRPAYATIRDASASYLHQAEGFDRVLSYANRGGDDNALLYDSPGEDSLTATPAYARMTGAGFSNYANGYGKVSAYALAGGGDAAFLYDSPGVDRLVATPVYARLDGNGFSNYARQFESVYAYASADGSEDWAYLYDSAQNDALVATPKYTMLEGASYRNSARGFTRVYAHATSGTDTAYLYDSAGNDLYVSTANYARLQGLGYYNYAGNFDQVYSYATAGGIDDRALYYDSTGNDDYVAHTLTAQMTGANFSNYGYGFDKSFAYARSGGFDTANVYDTLGDDALVASGATIRLSGLSYYRYGTGFDDVTAHATQGGHNTASVRAVDYIFRQVGDWD